MTLYTGSATLRKGQGFRLSQVTAPPHLIVPEQAAASQPRDADGGRIALLLAWVARELRIYWTISQDPRTPTRSKVFLWAAVGYAVWPLGLVPDFIPVVGYVDDLIIVPTLIFIAVRSVPPEVARDARQGAD